MTYEKQTATHTLADNEAEARSIIGAFRGHWVNKDHGTELYSEMTEAINTRFDELFPSAGVATTSGAVVEAVLNIIEEAIPSLVDTTEKLESADFDFNILSFVLEKQAPLLVTLSTYGTDSSRRNKTGLTKQIQVEPKDEGTIEQPSVISCFNIYETPSSETYIRKTTDSTYLRNLIEELHRVVDTRGDRTLINELQTLIDREHTKIIEANELNKATAQDPTLEELCDLLEILYDPELRRNTSLYV